MVNPKNLVRLALLLLLPVIAQAAGAAPKKDYIVTGSKPDRLFVIDAAARRVVGDFKIPGAHDWVGTIVPSPDGRVAYVLVNRMESIAGIDLGTGKEVFRADLSSPGERVKSLFAFDVTPDGKRLIVYEVPVKLGLSEYQVEPTRFAIFDTNAGLHAKPVREYPAPRRVHTLLASKNDRTFYAIGFDLYEYDIATGKRLDTRGIRHWDHPGHSRPDLLAFWPVSEPTGIFATPIYSTRTPASGHGAPVPVTSLMTLNLRTGALAYHDVEKTSALIFSAVMSPTEPAAFGVYTQLTKIGTHPYRVEKRVDLPHTYYAVLVSTDGKEVYTAGAMCDVTVFDADTLAEKANIRLPGCGDQSVTSPRLVRR